MPIFMDRHEVSGVTAKDVAEVHQLDLEIQDKFNCKGLTYWFDEGRGSAFCLVEAPEKNAVKAMHEHAHGLIPNQIIEVQSNVVEAFLGRISDTEISDDHDMNQSAFRTIMYVELKYAVSMYSKLKENNTIQLLSLQDKLICQSLKQYEGRVARDMAGGFLASFSSTSNSIKCATDILKNVKRYNGETSGYRGEVAIGLSTGDPVTGEDEFFGEAIQLAKRLCSIAGDGQMVLSSSMKDYFGEINEFAGAKQKHIKTPKPSEEFFLNQLMDITEELWNDDGFNVELLGREIGLSKSQLYRKTTSLTGNSPNIFIKDFRLKNAARLIEKQQNNIAEIAYDSGFKNPSYFTKCFQKRFGVLPSDYANTIA